MATVKQSTGKDLKPSIEWVPFLLNRDTPEQGYDLDEYINAKYGDGVSRQAAVRLDQAGRSCGIVFNRQRRIVNTINSHRLMEFVNNNYGFLIGDKVMNNLFKLYFENAKDISKDDILLESLDDVEEIKDKDTIKTFLKTNQFQTEVMNADKSAKQSRINGVPHITFIKDGAKLSSLSGGQPAEVFEQVLLDYLENLE